MRKFTQGEIAQSLGVSQRQISDDLAIMRNRDLKAVEKAALQDNRVVQNEAAHEIHDLVRESWTLYSRALRETPPKLGLALQVLIAIGGHLRHLHNVRMVVPSAETIWFTSQFQRMDQEMEELRKKMPDLEELRMLNKIQPP